MTKAVEAKAWNLHAWPDGSKCSRPYPGDYTNFSLADGYGGETDGELFGDVEVTGNLLHADHVIVNGVNNYTDSIWLLKPSVLRLPSGYFIETEIVLTGDSTDSFEVQHEVCGRDDFSFIEVLFQEGGTGVQFAHQSGALPGWSILDGSTGRAGSTTPTPTETSYGTALANGDLIRTEVRPTFADGALTQVTVVVLKNGVEGPSITIPSTSDYFVQGGHLAGIGFYVAEGQDPEDFCFAKDSIVIGALPSED